MQDTNLTTQRGKSPTSTARKILFSLVIVGLVFGVPELFLRFFWQPPPERPYVGNRKFVEWLSQLSLADQPEKAMYQSDAARLWKLIPNVQATSFNPHFAAQSGDELQAIAITINEKGYRGALVQTRAQPSSFRVLCMGDSNFFGYPLDDGDVFPNVLANALQRELKSAKAEVINGGIPGYTVLQGKIWYDQLFHNYDFDWLLLSYLNNDAWPQPQADSALLARRTPEWLTSVGQSIQLVRWAQSWRGTDVAPEQLVPRLSLAEFLDGYRGFINAARDKGAKVLILDYRAYQEYEPYSRALADLANELHVDYFPVAERLEPVLAEPESLRRYERQRAQVRRRWGPLLDEKPYLRVYAEYSPEHLNEVGAAWLADDVAPMLAAGRK